MKKSKINRMVKFDLTSLNKENRTIDIAASSEELYLRSFGFEKLLHDVGNIDFSRMDAGAPLLYNHNLDDRIGKVERYSLDDDKVLRATVKFSRSSRAQEIFNDVEDGILGQVSIGYMINNAEVNGERDGTPIIDVTSWSPYEISFVTVAADPTVGVGRSIEEVEEVEVITEALNAFKTRSVETTTTEIIEEEIKAVEEEITTTVEENTNQDAGDIEELDRVKTIKSLGVSFGKEELAEQFILNKKSVEDFKSELTNKTILIKKENKKMFNLNKVLRSLANGQVDESVAELNAATKSDFSNVLQRSAASGTTLTLPMEALFSRDYNVSTPAKGGDVVDKVIDGSKLIETLYAKNAISELGISVYSLPSETSMPRQLVSDVVSYGYGEVTSAAQHNESEFELITLKPHRMAMFSRVTRQMLSQSSFDIASLIQNQMIVKFGLEQQRSVFGVGGINQPVGLDGNGISAVTGATFSTNARAKLIDMIVSIASKEGQPGKWFMNYATYAKFMQVKLDDGSGLFLARDGRIEGIEVVISNAVANDTVYLGAWSNVILANFGAVNMYVDPNYKTGLVDFVWESFFDVNVMRPDHIVKAVFAA